MNVYSIPFKLLNQFTQQVGIDAPGVWQHGFYVVAAWTIDNKPLSIVQAAATFDALTNLWPQIPATTAKT